MFLELIILNFEWIPILLLRWVITCRESQELALIKAALQLLDTRLAALRDLPGYLGQNSKVRVESFNLPALLSHSVAYELLIME